MGINQAFSPLGIVFGYMVTGMLAQNINDNAIWRIGIFLQAIFLIPVTFFIISTDEKDIDVDKNPNRVVENGHRFQSDSLAYFREVSFVNIYNHRFCGPIRYSFIAVWH